MNRDMVAYLNNADTSNAAATFFSELTGGEKVASGLNYVIPTALGLGAAGTAAVVGMREAKADARLRVLRDIKDERKRSIAEASVDDQEYKRVLPATVGAGLGAMYLTGQHVSAENYAKGLDSLKGMSTRSKLLHAPGTAFQAGLKRLGASAAQAKGLAGAATLATGYYAGKALGKRVANRAFEEAGVSKKELPKTAGLFMRPSDISGDHRDLSAALEGRLNGTGQRDFRKEADVSPLVSAGVGAAIGLAYEPVRQIMRKPSPEPPPQDPKGVVDKIRYKLDRRMYENDQWKRKHPVTSALISGAAGAAAGAAVGLGGGPSAVVKSLRGRV